MSIIANTTVISNFAGINRINLLQQVYGKIYISAQVYEEVKTGLEEGYLFYKDIKQSIYPFSKTGWIQLTGLIDDNEFNLFGKIPKKLGKGESSCLTIAAQRKWLFLTDDLDARKQAKLLKIRISGSLGCLILAIEKNICNQEQGNQLLYQMIKNGYRSPVHDLRDLG